MTVDFDKPVDKVISPWKLAHVVLRTSPAQFQTMVTFYKDFLGAETTYENEFLSFLTYDDEHHRIAIGAIPGTSTKVPTSSGLEHMAFSFPTLTDLVLAYRQRKAKGIHPIWSVNHGPTTSIYYQDPDGNQIETQVDNFDKNEDANDFMASKSFSENPIGVDFDPEVVIKQLLAGESDAKLKQRKDIGPRGVDSIPPPPQQEIKT